MSFYSPVPQGHKVLDHIHLVLDLILAQEEWLPQGAGWMMVIGLFTFEVCLVHKQFIWILLLLDTTYVQDTKRNFKGFLWNMISHTGFSLTFAFCFLLGCIFIVSLCSSNTAQLISTSGNGRINMSVLKHLYSSFGFVCFISLQVLKSKYVSWTHLEVNKELLL